MIVEFQNQICLHPFPGSRSPPGKNGSATDPLAAFEMTRLATLWKMYSQTNGPATNGLGGHGAPVSLPSLPSLPTDMFAHHQDKAAAAAGLNLHLMERQKALEEAAAAKKEAETKEDHEETTIEPVDEDDDVRVRSHNDEDKRSDVVRVNGNSNDASQDSRKRRHSAVSNDDEVSPLEVVDTTGDCTPKKRSLNTVSMPGANIKISSRGEINKYLNISRQL